MVAQGEVDGKIGGAERGEGIDNGHVIAREALVKGAVAVDDDGRGTGGEGEDFAADLLEIFPHVGDGDFGFVQEGGIDMNVDVGEQGKAVRIGGNVECAEPGRREKGGGGGEGAFEKTTSRDGIQRDRHFSLGLSNCKSQTANHKFVIPILQKILRFSPAV